MFDNGGLVVLWIIRSNYNIIIRWPVTHPQGCKIKLDAATGGRITQRLISSSLKIFCLTFLVC